MDHWLSFITALIGFAVAINQLRVGIRTRNPAKRRYWEREFQDRLGPDKRWPTDAYLQRRARTAVAYLDADEAIRRVGFPSPAASWLAGVIFYICAVVASVQMQDSRKYFFIGTASDSNRISSILPTWAWLLIAILLLAGCVWAFIDATINPKKRLELQRVLVGVIMLPGGDEILSARPESFISPWMNRKTRRIMKTSTKEIKDAGIRYQMWAKRLFARANDPSQKILFETRTELN